jgi:D-3-phosphoglycerate dehydrogenase
VLITDSLFIQPGSIYENRLREAGYEIERLDVPEASEEQLIAAIPGKVGYILGGVEHVTEPVLAAGTELRAIAFTGSGYKKYIPSWEAATDRGIAISAATGANAEAVGEFTIAAALAQVRQLPTLMVPGGKGFAIAREFSELTFGVIGYGWVGKATARKAAALGFRVVIADAPVAAGEPGETVSLSELLSTADIVALHVSDGRGDNVLNAVSIAALKPGSIVVNAAFERAVDNDALLTRIKDGSLRAAVDYPLSTDGLPIGALLTSNGSTAFNTQAANERASDRATASLIKLLESGDDVDLVNPDYRSHR